MASNFPVNILDGTFTVVYDSGSFMSPGVYSFAIYPNADTVILDIGGQRLFDTSSMPYRFSFTMDSPEVSPDTLENLPVVATVCEDDHYHYGFNGQMKVNEWAGLGNHT